MKYWILRVEAPNGGLYSIWTTERAARKAAWEVSQEKGWECEIVIATGENLKIQQANVFIPF